MKNLRAYISNQTDTNSKTIWDTVTLLNLQQETCFIHEKIKKK